jgi:hypothetical protein
MARRGTKYVCLVVAGVLLVGAVGGVVGVHEESDRYLVETSGGEEFCVSPITGTENVGQFYGQSTDGGDSMIADTGFEQPQTGSLLLYRNTSADALSLVFVHGSTNESDLRRADYELSGFEGASWVVKDDPESFPYDSYESSNGTITGVNWRWESGTDGGAVGPLTGQVSLSITATTQQIDTWRMIGGHGGVAGTLPVGGTVNITGPSESGPCATATPTQTATTTEANDDGAGFGMLTAAIALFIVIVSGRFYRVYR